MKGGTHVATTHHGTAQRGHKAALVFIFIALFMDTTGIGLSAPILPQLVTQLQGGGVSAASHVYGALLATYAAMLFVFSPFQGTLSDQFGRRPLLVLSLFGTGCCYLLLAWAPSLTWLFIGQAVNGLTGASVTVGGAYIADVSGAQKRSQSFGLLGAAFGLGFIAGPALGGLLGSLGLRVPFLAAAGLVFLNCLFGLFFLPESLRKGDRQPFSWKRTNPVGAFGLLRGQEKTALSGILVCVYFGIQCLQSGWVLSTSVRFGWSTLVTGLSLAAVGVMSALVQGLLIRWVLPRYGEVASIRAGLVAGLAAFSIYAFAPNQWWMVPGIILGGFTGLGLPAVRGLISKRTSEHHQGAVQGAMTSLTTLTAVFGPLATTAAFGYFTGSGAPWRFPGVPFLLGALVYGVGAAIAWRKLGRPRLFASDFVAEPREESRAPTGTPGP